jgi:hypothetical protein
MPFPGEDAKFNFDPKTCATVLIKIQNFFRSHRRVCLLDIFYFHRAFADILDTLFVIS